MAPALDLLGPALRRRGAAACLLELAPDGGELSLDPGLRSLQLLLALASLCVCGLRRLALRPLRLLLGSLEVLLEGQDLLGGALLGGLRGARRGAPDPRLDISAGLGVDLARSGRALAVAPDGCCLLLRHVTSHCRQDLATVRQFNSAANPGDF